MPKLHPDSTKVCHACSVRTSLTPTKGLSPNRSRSAGAEPEAAAKPLHVPESPGSPLSEAKHRRGLGPQPGLVVCRICEMQVSHRGLCAHVTALCSV